ncbi:MAG: aminoacyl-histidine dipeptidase [Candidatus Riflebacteria bacterium]|nr:aminoacyl-histidine dipeptidase [Candidatus Riflebacteria bacterium]
MKKTKILSQILTIFEEISSVPRGSGNEAGIISWLQKRAEDNGFKCQTDEVGNVLIKVPASKGKEKSPTIIFQCHMDMVCEKTPDSKHDFLKDPIKLVYDEDILKAETTSLGADNGIGMALAFAAAEDPVIPHPPLELLFTVDEERGLTGAKALKPGFLKGTKLVNLDSEDEGVFTIGCAGGIDTHISLPLYYEEVPQNFTSYKIATGGMTGGHSGCNIHNERANAIRVLCRTLHLISGAIPFRMAYISGGTAHNAIPRSSETVIYLPEDKISELKKIVENCNETFSAEFKPTDPNLSITCAPFSGFPDRRAMNEYYSLKTVDLVLALPHGVAARSVEMPELVETSNNLAVVSVVNGCLEITTSQRSSVPSRLVGITSKIEAVARLAGANFKSGTGYPPWKPNFDSEFLAMAKAIFKKQFKKDAKVEVIHAGLECGLIGSIDPKMEMISLGPTIRNPHSPDEYLEVSSVEKVWKFIIALLKEIK